MTPLTVDCSETGCLDPPSARGLCVAHYARWRRNRPDHCSYCGGGLNGETGPTHDRCLAGRRDVWHRYRRQIIEAYGGSCQCCGETEDVFLTIDHVNGGGTAHRRSLGGGNRRMMLAIIAAGFPSEYQIQCFNCNLGRSRNGGICPHVAAVGQR